MNDDDDGDDGDDDIWMLASEQGCDSELGTALHFPESSSCS